MTSPGKFSPVPRGLGPEYLARWAPLNGLWRLAVYDRPWETVDSKLTGVPVTQPHPGDEWLAQLGFAADSEVPWVADGPDGWERPVVLVTAPAGELGPDAG